jgi:hypothetical protein
MFAPRRRRSRWRPHFRRATAERGADRSRAIPMIILPCLE